MIYGHLFFHLLFLLLNTRNFYRDFGFRAHNFHLFWFHFPLSTFWSFAFFPLFHLLSCSFPVVFVSFSLPLCSFLLPITSSVLYVSFTSFSSPLLAFSFLIFNASQFSSFPFSSFPFPLWHISCIFLSLPFPYHPFLVCMSPFLTFHLERASLDILSPSSAKKKEK